MIELLDIKKNVLNILFLTIFLYFICQYYIGDNMKVKIFDESHELDLEEAINCFISTGVEIIDIKFQTAIQIVGEDQIYCFSALIMYN